MKIKTSVTSVVPEFVLPRLLVWTCEQLTLPFAGIHTVDFRVSTTPMDGKVVFKDRVVTIGVNPKAKTPTTVKNSDAGESEWVQDSIELLILSTAMQLAYMQQYWFVSFTRAVRQPHVSQALVDRSAFKVLKAFREARPTLLAHWMVPPVEGALPEMVKAEDPLRYQKSAKEAQERVTVLRAEMAELAKKGKTVRSELHKLYMKIQYYKKAGAARKKEHGSVEWSIPERVVLADYEHVSTATGTTTGPGPENPPQRKETTKEAVIVE